MHIFTSLSPQDYVHYTNSSVLLMLPRTGGLCLHDVRTLIFEYGVAPLSGELRGSGPSGVIDDKQTAFARLDNAAWTRSRLLESYGRKKTWKLLWSDQTCFLEYVEAQLKCNDFGNVMLLIIDVMRHKQMGAFPELSAENRQKIQSLLTEVAQRVTKRFILSAIGPKYLEYKPTHEDRGVFSKTIRKGLDQVPLDLLYQDDISQLNTVKNIFPEFFSEEPKELSDNQLYLWESIIYDQSTLFLCTTSVHFEIFLNSSCYPNARKLLTKERKDQLFFECTKAIQELEKMLDRAFRLLDGSQACFQLSPEQQDKALKPFPIAFFVNHETQQLRPVQNELRADKACELGSDIRVLGVLPENKEELLGFLKTHGLENKIAIVHIESTPENTIVLHNTSAITDLPPSSPFLPGFDRLAFVNHDVSEKQASNGVRIGL